MKLVLDSDPRILTVRSYAPGRLVIGERTVQAPCILSPSRLIEDWGVQSLEALTILELAPLLALNPKIVLLGTQATQRLTPSAVRQALRARGVALESMELGAACRTYNILAQEYREVVAGLLP